MSHYDLRVDAYIAKAADFAQPILIHFRELVHKTCPGVLETMKWACPHFDYKGQILCSMAAFKSHATAGFWKASLMKSGQKLMEHAKSETAMGHLGKLSSIKELPKDAVLIRYIKEAMKLNEEGVKLSSKKKAVAVPPVKAPAYFLKALSKNKKALNAFEEFSNSHKREYIQWIEEAKTEITREKRLTQTLKWLSEGKSRNWKYEKK